MVPRRPPTCPRPIIHSASRPFGLPHVPLPFSTSLVSIRILPNPPPLEDDLEEPNPDGKAEETLLSVLAKIRSLTLLELPACWTFESVEHECETRGVKLSYTDKCTSAASSFAFPGDEKLS